MNLEVSTSVGNMDCDLCPSAPVRSDFPASLSSLVWAGGARSYGCAAKSHTA
jgi:hypothetical protein